MKSHRSMRNPKSSGARRREPNQIRGRATYDAILDGAAKALVDHGITGITTNKISEAAGVSIGSVYQYFDDKEEILLAMAERHAEAVRQIVLASVSAYASAPLDEIVPALIAGILSFQRGRRDLFRLIREQVPLSSPFNCLPAILKFVTDIVAVTLAARQNELGLRDPNKAAFVVVHAIDGLLEGALRHFPDGKEEELMAEASELALGYLRGLRSDGRS